jgi:hypothetical protein
MLLLDFFSTIKKHFNLVILEKSLTYLDAGDGNGTCLI